jgi:F0F1-type ATP synthase assembly protein I
VRERPGSAGELFHKARYTGGRSTSLEAAPLVKKGRSFPFARSARSLQDNVARSGAVAGASYTLVGGIILLGGIGYAVDLWQETSPWFLITGLTLGIIVGFYELVKTVYRG